MRTGRDPADVTLLAVSKSVSLDRLLAARAAGHELFGENRVQEGEAKAPRVPGARWHLVGRLQGNKARRALLLFESVHSVESVELAERLDRLVGDVVADGVRTPWSGPLPVYFQVNVDADNAKAGFDPAALERSLDRLLGLERLGAVGLMTVGRLVDTPAEARSTFRALRELSERLRARQPRLGSGLSMGMTDDFEVAVEEGSTIVRIGRALFGERPTE